MRKTLTLTMAMGMAFLLLLGGDAFARGGRSAGSSRSSSSRSVSRSSSSRPSVSRSPSRSSSVRRSSSSISRTSRPSVSRPSVSRTSRSSSYSRPTISRPSTTSRISRPSTSRTRVSTPSRTSSYRIPSRNVSKGTSTIRRPSTTSRITRPSTSSYSSGRTRLTVPRSGSSSSTTRPSNSAGTIRLAPAKGTSSGNTVRLGPQTNNNNTIRLGPSRTSASSDGIRRQLLSRYQQRFGVRNSGTTATSYRPNNSYTVRPSTMTGAKGLSRNSYTVRQSPLTGVNALSRNSYSVRPSTLSGRGALNTSSYSVRGRPTSGIAATSKGVYSGGPLAGPGIAARDSIGRLSYRRGVNGQGGLTTAAANHRLRVDAAGDGRYGRSTGSSSTLHWGTTAFGSRSAVGTYLSVPLGGRGGAGPHFNYYHHSYHHGHGRYRHHHRHTGWWCRHNYYPWHNSSYLGIHLGLGYGGLYYSGWYAPSWYHYPGYAHVGWWYRPGLVRSHYVYSGYPYWGTSVVRHYYHYDDGDYYYPPVVDQAPVLDEPAVQQGEVVNVSHPGVGQQAVPAASPVQTDEAFLESLTPAELSFVTGLVSFRGGDYEQSAQAFYNATLSSPETAAPRLFLAINLFSLGEFKRSADYLSDVYGKLNNLPRYRLDILRLYGADNRVNLDRHQKTLADYIALYPAQTDGYLVRGYVRYCLADYAGAAQDFERVLTLNNELVVAGAFLQQLKSMQGKGPEAAPPVLDDFQSFLNALRLQQVKSLKL